MYQLFRTSNFRRCPDRRMPNVRAVGTTAAGEMRKEIGMIFQHFNLLMQKNVLENICFSLKIAGVKDAEAKKRARELLEVVGLADKEKAYPSQLSGGQKQKSCNRKSHCK